MVLTDTVGRWHRDFLKNIRLFESAGLSADEANNFLIDFLKLSASTPLPRVMETFKKPELFEEVGVYTPKDPEISQFMMRFLSPVMKNFKVEGIENLEKILPLTKSFPITLISNHLSHLDAPAIFQLIHQLGPVGKEIADRLVFIAGRLAFEPDFTRLGLYMFGTLLVCSKKDMADNPSLSDIMTKINMRSFRQSQKLQNDGKIICIFPEGTRSRDGHLLEFVDTVYHYVGNKIILPIALEGTDSILPTSGFILNQARGKLVIGNPVLVGKLHPKLMEKLPSDLEQLTIPEDIDARQFVIDNLALLVGKNLSKHKHGVYRNLYNGCNLEKNKNELIFKASNPEERITILGNSKISVSMAAILANKPVEIVIYHPDPKLTNVSQINRRDMDNFPLYKLPPNINFTSDPSCIAESTLILNGSNPWEMDFIYQPLQNTLKSLSVPVVNISKGFTKSETGLISDKLIQEYHISPNRLSVISGAAYADQIMDRKISGLEIASNQDNTMERLSKLFSTGYTFTQRAKIPQDIKGLQLGGALKSIYALTMGIMEGYYKNRYGGNLDNTLFQLSSLFFQEMVTLGVQAGGHRETFQGPSGWTDFMQSSFGSSSNNRTAGFQMANGEWQKQNMTNGIFGLEILGSMKNFPMDHFKIIHATYDFVILKNDIEETAEKIQELLMQK